MVFLFYIEFFNIIVCVDFGINGVVDLKGKCVNIGNLGFGDCVIMGVVMDVMGWINDSFKFVFELKGFECF